MIHVCYFFITINYFSKTYICLGVCTAKRKALCQQEQLRSNAFQCFFQAVITSDELSRSRNLSMGTQILSAFQTYNRVVGPNYGQNNHHLPNYGHMVMVKGRDKNNYPIHSPGTSSTMGPQNTMIDMFHTYYKASAILERSKPNSYCY